MNLFAYFIVFAGFTFHFSLFTLHSSLKTPLPHTFQSLNNHRFLPLL